MLIEVKVKVARIIDNKVKKKSETYILDKELFSEAEYDVMAGLSTEQELGTVDSFEIVSLRLSSIKEIDEQTIDNRLPPFIATLLDLFHEDDGTEKQIRYKVLLWAEDLTAANQRAHELSYQGYDMLIEGIKQVDYFYIRSVGTVQEIEEEEE